MCVLMCFLPFSWPAHASAMFHSLLRSCFLLHPNLLFPLLLVPQIRAARLRPPSDPEDPLVSRSPRVSDRQHGFQPQVGFTHSPPPLALSKQFPIVDKRDSIIFNCLIVHLLSFSLTVSLCFFSFPAVHLLERDNPRLIITRNIQREPHVESNLWTWISSLTQHVSFHLIHAFVLGPPDSRSANWLLCATLAGLLFVIPAKAAAMQPDLELTAERFVIKPTA